jgi:hypothetical protein
MNESIVVGLVVGVGVAAVGAIVGHYLRLREMREQWDEDERKRKSERRQKLLEDELAVIREFADVNTDLWNSIIWWSQTDRLLDAHAKAELGNQAFLMHARANIAALSIGDRRLKNRVKKIIELMEQCNKLLDPKTSKPHVGKEGEYKKALWEMRKMAADIRRRSRGLLEET